MPDKKVLIVEDDASISELIKFNLEDNGYVVFVAADGKTGLDMAMKEIPDLLILDIMLPVMDGIDVANRLRNNKETKDIPILMLTAKSSEIDKIIGLEIGADDYMTKPFSVRELMARIKAVLRRYVATRSDQVTDKVIKTGGIIIDDEKHEVSRNGKVYQLTLKEYELLRILAINRGKVLSRNTLLDEVWGYDYFGETRTVDVHIRHLRSKIEDDEYERMIETVRGVGYRMSEDK